MICTDIDNIERLLADLQIGESVVIGSTEVERISYAIYSVDGIEESFLGALSWCSVQ